MYPCPRNAINICALQKAKRAYPIPPHSPVCRYILYLKMDKWLWIYRHAEYTFFSYKKLSERVRAKNFLNFREFKGYKFLNSFLTRSGVKTDIDLEFGPSPI